MRRRWLVVVLAGGLALTGCATTSSTNGSDRRSPVITSANFCVHTGQFNLLTLKRITDDPRRVPAFARVVHVDDPATAARVARAVCALPTFPGGLPCPYDGDVVYRLAFGYAVAAPAGSKVAEGERFVTATLKPTGCGTLAGVGADRWFSGHEGFFAVLGAAIGLAGATRDTFVGTPTIGVPRA